MKAKAQIPIEIRPTMNDISKDLFPPTSGARETQKLSKFLKKGLIFNLIIYKCKNNIKFIYKLVFLVLKIENIIFIFRYQDYLFAKGIILFKKN